MVTFRNKSCSIKDEMEQHYNISAIDSQRNTEAVNNNEMSTIYDVVYINNTIINSVDIKTLI